MEELELDDILEIWISWTQVHHKGAKSSLGVPQEPEDMDAYPVLEKVSFLGRDITDRFDTSKVFSDTDEIEKHIKESI